MKKPSKIAKQETAPDLHAQLGLLPGQSLELLKALHILTRDGKINQDSRRKLKQVRHLIQLIQPLLQELATAHPDRHTQTVVDHGAGKSYLGFMLYDAYAASQVPKGDAVATQNKGSHQLSVHGVENREELVQRSVELAKACGFTGMHFHALDTQDALTSDEFPEHIDLVTALHACNTATDDAITFGLHRKCDAFALVPCCQAEVAAAMRLGKQGMLSQTPLSELWRHPIHTRELGSQLTNVLRCLRLEASGYDVTVTELVGWEHAMKNELILARRTGKPRHSAAKRQREILATFGLELLADRFAAVV